MSYQKDTVHNNNLYIRCWECGDSGKRSYVAHMNINLSNGLYHCFRCGASGKLTISQWLDITSDMDIAMPTSIIDISELTSLPIELDERFTLLTSQYNFSKGYRQWAMRNPMGKIIGYHHRYAGKISENIGQRGLGYVGMALLSNNILRVVEGAYDVVLPDSVCVFGKITSGSIRMLSHYDLCLCPDSDVLQSRQGLLQLIKTVEKNPNVAFVELLREGDAYDYYISGKGRGKILGRNEFIKRAKEIL